MKNTINSLNPVLEQLSLNINNDKDMHTEHPSVGMLSPFQPIGICIEP